MDLAEDTETVRQFETVALTKSGKEVPVLLNGRALKDADGKTISFIATIYNITDRKESEKLIQYQRDFENLVTEISTKFINLPADKTDRGIEQALKVLGEFAGVDRAYVFHLSEDISELSNTHEWSADGIESFIGELQHVSFDSVPWWMDELRKLEVIEVPSVDKLPVEASGEKKIFQAESVQSLIAVPMVYDGRLIGFVGFDSVREEKRWDDKSVILLRIIAEIFVNTIMRHETQQELEDYQSKMFRAEQLASLGTISATIAHELNQPLTVIRLFLQQSLRGLKKKKPDIEKIKENIQDSLDDITRTASTVDRFRKFAIKSSPANVRKVNLSEIAERMVTVLKGTAKRSKMNISLDLQEGPIYVRGDIAELEQIFFVLIQNSIQAADGKSLRELKITISKQSGQIHLVFSDTCGGIDEKHFGRIFEPFFTTKSGETGTGLGLCILERIVRRYKGVLNIDNQPGHGISFYINLPTKI
jgi:signal transduction histidine kinase